MDQSHRSHSLHVAQLQALRHHRSRKAEIGVSPSQAIDHGGNHQESQRFHRAIDHLAPLYIGGQRMVCDSGSDSGPTTPAIEFDHSGTAVRGRSDHQSSVGLLPLNFCHRSYRLTSAETGRVTFSGVNMVRPIGCSVGDYTGLKWLLSTIELLLRKRFYMGCIACSSCRSLGSPWR